MTSDPELRGRVERDPVFLSGVRNVTDEEEGELHPLTNLHRNSPSTNSTNWTEQVAFMVSHAHFSACRLLLEGRVDGTGWMEGGDLRKTG